MLFNRKTDGRMANKVINYSSLFCGGSSLWNNFSLFQFFWLPSFDKLMPFGFLFAFSRKYFLVQTWNKYKRGGVPQDGRDATGMLEDLKCPQEGRGMRLNK
jgi:hypothetical protein